MKFSVQDLVQLQLATGMSNNKMKQLATTIRQQVGRNSIQSNFQAELALFGVEIKQEYVVSDVMIGKEGVQVAHCQDFNILVGKVLDLRGLNPHETMIKLSIDGGQNFLKMIASFINLERNTDVDPSEFVKSNLTSDRFRDSGVLKAVPVAVAQVSETPESLEKILDLVQVDSVLFKIAADLKVGALLLGLQSAASCHPCIWCNVHKDHYFSAGETELRTFGSIREQAALYRQGGNKNAKFYFNCVRDPLLKEENDTLVLDIDPPMELHIFMGVTSRLFNFLVDEMESLAMSWIKELHLEKSVYHGSTSFNGRSCRVLVQNYARLEALAPNDGSRFRLQRFIQVFRSLDTVVDSCFGTVLREGYATDIEIFEQAYIDLGYPASPKVHALITHIPQFISRSGKSLGLFSEQSCETFHSLFQNTWKSRFARKLGHPDYSQKLLECVQEVAAKHSF